MVGVNGRAARWGGVAGCGHGVHLSALPGNGGLMAYWYPVALVFGALHLTTIGGRVARYLIQEMAGRVYAPFRQMNWWPWRVAEQCVCRGFLGLFDRDRKHFHHLADVRRGQSIVGHAGALYRHDGVDQNVEVALSLWVTAIPMLFVGGITLAGSYEMFWMFLAKAAKLAAGQAFALYLDAVLVAVVAILGIVVLSDSMKQWYGYVILKRPFSSSEVIATAGGGSAGRAQTAIHRQDERTFMLPPGGGCC